MIYTTKKHGNLQNNVIKLGLGIETKYLFKVDAKHPLPRSAKKELL